jgi:hypothetical protein
MTVFHAECHNAECLFAECRGAVTPNSGALDTRVEENDNDKALEL